jgi:prefoldin subunit 5
MARSTLLAASTGCIILLCAFFAGPALAADVQLSDGKKFQTRKIEYSAQTRQFVFNYQGSRFPRRLEEVKEILVDESALDALAQQLNSAKALNQAAEARARQLDQELDKYKELVRQYQQAPSPAAGPAGAAPPADASRTIQRLNDDNQQLRNQLEDLQKQLQEKAASSLSSATATAALPPRPVISGPCRMIPSKAPGFITVMGECSNPTAQTFRDVVIELTAYDKSGKPLRMGYTYLSNLASGKEGKRSFEGDIEVADPGAVYKVEAVVTEAFGAVPPAR